MLQNPLHVHSPTSYEYSVNFTLEMFVADLVILLYFFKHALSIPRSVEHKSNMQYCEGIRSKPASYALFLAVPEVSSLRMMCPGQSTDESSSISRGVSRRSRKIQRKISAEGLLA